MTPSHASNSAQSSAAPYEIVVSASEYAGGDTLTGNYMLLSCNLIKVIERQGSARVDSIP